MAEGLRHTYLEPRHIINDRFIKDANKTEKQMNIKLIPLAKKIIEKYKEKSDYYIIPYMKIHLDFSNTQKYKKQIESETTTINKYLKIIADMLGIEKKYHYTCMGGIRSHIWQTYME